MTRKLAYSLVVVAVATLAPAWSVWAACSGCCPAACGDGIVDPEEGCDDGNRADDDGCSSTCTSDLLVERVGLRGTCDPSIELIGTGALGPSGGLIVTGSTGYCGGTNGWTQVLAQFTRDLAPDVSFGDQGVVALPFGGNIPQQVVVQDTPSGPRFILAGSASPAAFTLVRTNLDGSVDSSFGTLGTATAEFAGSTVVGGVEDIAQLPNGGLVAVGTVNTGGSWDFAVASFSPEGALVGSAVLDLPLARNEGKALAVQPDGKILITGFSWSSSYSSQSQTVVRLSASDLQLDAGFGSGGRVSTNLPCATVCTQGLDVEVLSTGRIVVLGSYSTSTEQGYALTGYRPDGTLDPGFGTNGRATHSFIPGVQSFAGSMALQPDGRILVAGNVALRAPVGYSYAGAVARLLPTGALDAAFPAPRTSELLNALPRKVLFRQGESDAAERFIFLIGSAMGEGPSVSLARYRWVDDTPSTCEFAVSGTPCVADASLCSTDRCDGAGACIATFEPSASCRRPVATDKASLKLLSSAEPVADQVQFKWTKGPVVLNGEYGSPDVDTIYELCLYDTAGGIPNLVFNARPQLGAECEGQRCWRASRNGWNYASSSGAPMGITGVKLKEGSTAGKASVQVKARGQLTLPALPLAQDPHVVAELRNSSGQCFGAWFTSAQRNDVRSFTAKGE